jgi:hypothetical protein
VSDATSPQSAHPYPRPARPDWTCLRCGESNRSDWRLCHHCDTVRPLPTDWYAEGPAYHLDDDGELTLCCDAPGCTAQLALIAGVAREDHSWGRLSLYGAQNPTDMDLCPKHHQIALSALHTALRGSG